MKVLSIRQPWPTLIGMGIKDIENRNWKTNHRGRFLLHAPDKIEMEIYTALANSQFSLYLPKYRFQDRNQ